MSRIPISIGSNCIPAAHLDALGLRRESYPLDWLGIQGVRSIAYVHALIATDFADFTSDLRYDAKGFVVAGRYPETLFGHHDLIGNRIGNPRSGYQPCEESLVQVYNRRASRFLTVLAEQPVLLISAVFHSEVQFSEDYIASVGPFLAMLEERKVDAELAVVLFDDQAFEVALPLEQLRSHDRVHLAQFVRDQDVNPWFGSTATFAACLKDVLPTGLKVGTFAGVLDH